MILKGRSELLPLAYVADVEVRIQMTSVQRRRRQRIAQQSLEVCSGELHKTRFALRSESDVIQPALLEELLEKERLIQEAVCMIVWSELDVISAALLQELLQKERLKQEAVSMIT